MHRRPHSCRGSKRADRCMGRSQLRPRRCRLTSRWSAADCVETRCQRAKRGGHESARRVRPSIRAAGAAMVQSRIGDGGCRRNRQGREGRHVGRSDIMNTGIVGSGKIGAWLASSGPERAVMWGSARAIRSGLTGWSVRREDCLPRDDRRGARLRRGDPALHAVRVGGAVRPRARCPAAGENRHRNRQPLCPAGRRRGRAGS